MTHVDLAAGARLVRLRGADDAGAPRHLSLFLLRFVWQRFLRPGELGWVCRLHGLRQATNGREVSEEYWLAVRTARSLHKRQVAPNERSKAWAALLASVLQYASPPWLPNLGEVLVAACCGLIF